MTMAGRPLEFTIYDLRFSTLSPMAMCQRYSHKRRHAGDQWPVHRHVGLRLRRVHRQRALAGNRRAHQRRVRLCHAHAAAAIDAHAVCHPCRHGRGLSGTLPVSQVSGVVPLAQLPVVVMTNNATGVTLGGTFNGNATTATTLSSLATNTAPPVPSSINVCWGDSLTLGINGGGADLSLIIQMIGFDAQYSNHQPRNWRIEFNPNKNKFSGKRQLMGVSNDYLVWEKQLS